MGGSSWLSHGLDKYMPHPARFRLAWSLTHWSNHFYAWEPAAPGEDSVAIHKVWDDSGLSGRAGSIWVFTTLNLNGFVNGSDPQRKRPFSLLSRRFFMNEYTKTG